MVIPSAKNIIPRTNRKIPQIPMIPLYSLLLRSLLPLLIQNEMKLNQGKSEAQ